MKLRWKDILKNMDVDHEYEGVRYCPKWYRGCDDESKDNVYTPKYDWSKVKSIIDSASPELDKHVGIDISIQDNSDNSDRPNFNKQDEVDEISKALADAMLESVSSSLSDKDVLDISLTKHDLSALVSTRSPRFSDNVLVDHSDTEDVPEIPEDELFDNKVFPNPFEMSPEYVNRKESLYSMSENITSLNLDALTSKLFLQNGGGDQVKLTNYVTENSTMNQICEGKRNIDPSLLKSMNSQLNSNISSTDKMIECNGNPEIIPSDNCNDSIQCQNNEDDTDQSPLYTDTNETIKTEKSNLDLVETCADKKSYDHLDQPVFQFDDIGDILATQRTSSEEDCSINENENANSNSNNNEIENDYEDGIGEINKEKDLITTNSNYLSAIPYENTFSRESLNTTEICSHEIQTRKLSVDDGYFETPHIAKSPTGETLEKLPPWIAQMIQASTPTSPRESKENKNIIDIDLEECLCQQTKEELELRKGQVELNKEVLGIVENANKFVNENMKFQSKQSTPKIGAILKSVLLESNADDETPIHDVTPTRGVTKSDYYSFTTNNARRDLLKDESSFLSPLSNSEANVFIHKTPSLKLVNEEDKDFKDGPGNTVVEESVTSKYSSCPYCSFEPETSTKFVLPLSLGEEQLKFMEIQAQVNLS